MGKAVKLRDVTKRDLSVFFQQQREPEACRMAGFPPRDRETFLIHWQKILSIDRIVKKAILFNGTVVGNIVSFDVNNERQVGYWLGKEYWGNGIATVALSLFLDQVSERPLYAYVLTSNLGSVRVLEKCGFRLHRKIINKNSKTGEHIEELIYIMDEQK